MVAHAKPLAGLFFFDPVRITEMGIEFEDIQVHLQGSPLAATVYDACAVNLGALVFNQHDGLIFGQQRFRGTRSQDAG